MHQQNDRKIISIIGGGNSTHSLIPLLSNDGHTVNLLTRNPNQWSKTITMEYTDPNGKIISTLSGNLNIVSKNPEDIIPQSEIIILSLPVSTYRILLNKIAPFIDRTKKVIIGTLYGQGGFNWMVDEIKNQYNLENIIYFASGLLPWITRTKEYGKKGINYGPKSVNVIAIEPKREFDYLSRIILDGICYSFFKTGKYHLADNFLSLTLSVDNQVIHLSRLYGLYKKFGGKWKNFEDIPFFYRDYDESSANFLRALDKDFSKIRKGIEKSFPNKKFQYMLDYLALERLSYNSANEDIKKSFINSKTLGQIPTPTILNDDKMYVFDKNHRFFTDDLYYGLLVYKWFADQLKIGTKTIDEIIYWAQDYIGDKILEDGKINIEKISTEKKYKYGIPSVYGFKQILDAVD